MILQMIKKLRKRLRHSLQWIYAILYSYWEPPLWDFDCELTERICGTTELRNDYANMSCCLMRPTERWSENVHASYIARYVIWTQEIESSRFAEILFVKNNINIRKTSISNYNKENHNALIIRHLLQWYLCF